MFLSVIIPAYNEEKRLPDTLKKVRDYLGRQKYDWEVLVVDDGSADRTAVVANDLIKDWPGFQIIGYQPNRGKGYAVKTGMLSAKGDWRLLMDADNSTDISEIEKLWPFIPAASGRPSLSGSLTNLLAPPDGGARPPLRSGHPLGRTDSYDIVIGSRYLNKDSIKVKQPLGRRVVSRLGNVLVRVLLGIKSADTQCGFKLFSAQSAEKIFPLQTIDRWGFDMEILTIAIKKGYRIKEVAVDWYDADDSQVKKSAALQTLKELLAIKWNLLRGRY